MATNNDYPSYLPEDFKGLLSVPDGNRRIYFRPQSDGTNILYGEIIAKGKIVIRYPEGSTIDIVPPNSVASEQIVNEAVEMEDLSKGVKSTMMTGGDRVTQEELDGFKV